MWTRLLYTLLQWNFEVNCTTFARSNWHMSMAFICACPPYGRGGGVASINFFFKFFFMLHDYFGHATIFRWLETFPWCCYVDDNIGAPKKSSFWWADLDAVPHLEVGGPHEDSLRDFPFSMEQTSRALIVFPNPPGRVVHNLHLVLWLLPKISL